MKNIKPMLAASLAVLSFQAGAAIIQGATVVQSSANHSGFPPSRLVDQSGLSLRYTSGVTSFDVYAASKPGHFNSSGSGGYFAPAPSYVIFDLGGTFTLSKLGLFNDHDFQSVKTFRVSISDQLLFNSSKDAGTFSANYFSTGSYSSSLPMEVFNLAPVSGRYARIDFLSAHADSNINVGEVIFGVMNTVPNTVPEPSSLLLLGMAGLAAGAARVRKLRKQ